jgi:uncharacterized membrane protein (DUF106 family)
MSSELKELREVYEMHCTRVQPVLPEFEKEFREAEKKIKEHDELYKKFSEMMSKTNTPPNNQMSPMIWFLIVIAMIIFVLIDQLP